MNDSRRIELAKKTDPEGCKYMVQERRGKVDHSGAFGSGRLGQN